MLAVFIVLLIVAKMPSGVALMCSAVVGAILSAIFSKTDLSLRQFIDGGFGYFDTILVIVAAMIFIVSLQKSGALEYFSVMLVKAFRKFPTLLLICFMIILMLPGMITGSSLSSVISVGAIVAPIMLKMGIPKAKTGAIIAFGAILGMIAPPVNVPVIAICDVVDIPYTGFTLPLLLLTFPMAIFAVLFLSRDFRFKKNNKNVNAEITKHYSELNEDGTTTDYVNLKKLRRHDILETSIILGVLSLAVIVPLVLMLVYKGKMTENSTFTNTYKTYLYLTIILGIIYLGIAVVMIFGRPYSESINIEEFGETINLNINKELNITCLIPLFLIVILYVGQTLLPRIIGILGSPLLFLIATIPAFFTGRKANPIYTLKEGVSESFGAMSLLIGVGMFMQVMTLSGVRGWFVINAISLSSFWQYISMIIALPIFGGISAFGSASILGGPYVMALIALNETIIASSCSLLAGMGELLPPTAMSANLAAKKVDDKYLNITKAGVVPLVLTIIYAMTFVILISTVWAL